MQIFPGSHFTSKRYLTPFLGFVSGLLLVLLLGACGKDAQPTNWVGTATWQSIYAQTAAPVEVTQTPNTETPTPLPEAPSTPNEQTPSRLGVNRTELKGVNVTVWYPWSGSAGVAMQTLLSEFNRTNQWGITVEGQSFEGFGRLDDAIEPALSAGSLPDILIDYGYQAQYLNAAGVIADLAPYVSDPVWGLTDDEQADFYPAFWEEDLLPKGSSQNEIRLGIPYYRSAYVLFYNQSWAKELGYPNPPLTKEDLRVRACAAANDLVVKGNKSVPGKGGLLVTAQPGAILGWIYAFGGKVLSQEGTGYQFNTPEASQALQYLNSLQASGCAWYDPDPGAATELASRGALMLAASVYDIAAQQDAFSQAGNLDEWVVIPFPSDTQPVVVTYGPSLMMTSSNPAQQLADWLVMEWLVYPPNQAEWVAEIEGLPTRSSTLSYLNPAKTENSHWEEALALLEYAQPEPSLVTWNTVRWTLSDAAVQLFDGQFTGDEISALLQNLDNVAGEIISQER